MNIAARYFMVIMILLCLTLHVKAQQDTFFAPYFISIGTNLELGDNVGVNDLYFNVGTFKPDFLRISGLKFGLEAGARRNIIENYEDFFNTEIRYKIDYLDLSNNQAYISSALQNRNSNLSLANTTYSFSPFINISSYQADSFKSELFLGVQFSIMQQKLNWTYVYDTVSTKLDTISIDNLSDFDFSENIFLLKENQFVHNVGLNLHHLISFRNFIYKGNIFLGYYNVLRSNNRNAENLYFGYSFSTIDTKFGINVNVEYIHFVNSGPFFNISIAKFFNLSSILEYK